MRDSVFTSKRMLTDTFPPRYRIMDTIVLWPALRHHFPFRPPPKLDSSASSSPLRRSSFQQDMQTIPCWGDHSLSTLICNSMRFLLTFFCQKLITVLSRNHLTTHLNNDVSKLSDLDIERIIRQCVVEIAQYFQITHLRVNQLISQFNEVREYPALKRTGRKPQPIDERAEGLILWNVSIQQCRTYTSGEEDRGNIRDSYPT